MKRTSSSNDVIVSKRTQSRKPLLRVGHPEVYTQINFQKAEEMGITLEKINTLTMGSHKKLPFKCSGSKCGCVHQWTASVKDRALKNSKCPGCTVETAVVCIHNNAAILCPWFLKQFDPCDNEGLSLYKLKPTSHVFVTWNCACVSCGTVHKWRTTLNSRKDGSGCPTCAIGTETVCKCQSLGRVHFELCQEINMDLSQQHDVFKLPPYSKIVLVWNCSKKSHHKPWSSTIASRTANENGCPTCCASKLEKTAEDILKHLDLHYIRQYRLPQSRFMYDFRVCRDDDWWLFELDGIQHFQGKTFGGSKKTIKQCFQDVVLTDHKKDLLAQKHSIDLLRIPYTVATLAEMQEYIQDWLRLRAEHKVTNQMTWFKMCVNDQLYKARDSQYQQSL
jgi:hypothetical protein